MAKVKKLKKKLRAERSRTAALQRNLTESNEVWDNYDDLQRWLRKHAPATLRRFEEQSPVELPRYRPHTMDEMLKHYYAPALRAQLNGSTTFFDAVSAA